ncbi:hypothetical protein BDY24DRAFT_371274 [Mrakia frigida]|uniref:DASH complex subunit ASK1 n=1 Tax=Mrakia frigida TaxID=29902 RepID=UPI003FCBFA8A
MSNPHNPRLHPPYTIIDGINPDSPDSQQMEQIDQLNVFLLQDIDEKFSNFHQVITTRLIPAVKKFNAVSEPTREAAKFWRTFFEAAAAVRVPVPTDYQLDPSAPPSSSSLSTSAQLHDPNASLPESHPSQSSESSFFADLPRGGTSSTPLNSNRYQQGGVDDQGTPNSDFIMESPVDRFSRLVQQDIEQDRSPSSSMGSGSMYGAGGARAKDPRDEVDYDSDLDSPDASFEDDQEAPTPQPQRQLQQQPLGNSADALANLTISSSGLPNFPVPTHSTTSAYGRASSSNQNTATLSHPQQLSSSFAQPRPSAATPRQARVAGGGAGGPLTPSNPFRSTPGQAAWNGLADLRSTPLTITSKPLYQSQYSQSRPQPPQPSSSYRAGAGAGGRDSDSDSDEDNLWPKGMSPPRTMNFTMPPSAKKKDPERMVPVDVGRGGGGIGERVKERLLAGAGGAGVGQQGGMPTPPRPGAGARGPPGGGRHFDIDDDDEDDYEEEDSIGGGGTGPHQLSTIPGSVSSVASQQPYYSQSIHSQQAPNSVSSNTSSYRQQQPQSHLLPNPVYSASSSASGSHYSHAPQPTHEDDNDSSSSSNSSNDSDDVGGGLEGDLSLSHLDHHPPPSSSSSLLPALGQPLNLNLSSQLQSGSMAASLLSTNNNSTSSYKANPPQTELDESFDYSDEDDSRFEQEEEERRFLQEQHQHQQQSQSQSQSQGAGGGPSSYLGAGSLGAGAGRRTSNLINFDDPFAGGPGSGEGGARYGAGLNAGGASKKFGLLGVRDEMLTFNGGRLEDAPLTESPTPFMAKK